MKKRNLSYNKKHKLNQNKTETKKATWKKNDYLVCKKKNDSIAM